MATQVEARRLSKSKGKRANSDLSVSQEWAGGRFQAGGYGDYSQWFQTHGQCVGQNESNTVFHPNSCSSNETAFRENQTFECSWQPSSWSDCTWPLTGEEFSEIGKGRNFDIPKSVPGGKLEGISNVQPTQRAELLKKGLRVMHDLDDTLICSGGSFPKGIDKECVGTHKNGLYPGVAELFYALSLSKDSEWGQRARHAMPFSARPKELRFFLAMKKCKGKDLKIRKRICKCPSRNACLAGDEKCLCFGLNTKMAAYGRSHDFFSMDYTKMGYRKFSNWNTAIFKKVSGPAVFFGDNGQGDFAAAQMMLLKSQGQPWSRGRVVAAFIHDVAHTCSDSECRKSWAEHNIFFFGSYTEAAGIAKTIGMLSEKRADLVKERATADASKDAYAYGYPREADDDGDDDFPDFDGEGDADAEIGANIA